MSTSLDSAPTRRWPSGVALAALLALYLGSSVTHLTVVPPVYEDEPWQPSTDLKLAREGVVGSDLVRGVWGSERRHYWFMPLHPLRLAATSRATGFGLESFDFRSIDVPLLLADARFTFPPRPAKPTLDTIAPEVVLLDERLRAYLSDAPATDPFPGALRSRMARRGFALTATVHEPTYETVEVSCTS